MNAVDSATTELRIAFGRSRGGSGEGPRNRPGRPCRGRRDPRRDGNCPAVQVAQCAVEQAREGPKACGVAPVFARLPDALLQARRAPAETRALFGQSCTLDFLAWWRKLAL